MTLQVIVIAVGMISSVGCDQWFFHEVDRQPDGRSRVEANGDARWLLLPICLALVAFFVAKQLGYRQLGVATAVAVLALNSVTVATVRLGMVRQARFERSVAVRLRWMLRAQAGGALAMFAGTGWHLLS